MNDLSPPDAPAASVANAPPPIAEAVNPADAETAAGFSPGGEADAPVEPPAPEPSLEPAPAAPAEAAPRLRPHPVRRQIPSRCRSSRRPIHAGPTSILRATRSS